MTVISKKKEKRTKKEKRKTKEAIKMFSDFKIILPLKVREQIQYWVDKADNECSGLGDAWLDLDKKEVRITRAFMLDQECSAVDTELDEKAIAKAMYEAHQDESNGIKRNIKFWWHSHVNMEVFWSGTDTKAMEELSEQSWFVNIVFNKKREMLGAISYPYKKEAVGYIEEGITYDNDLKIEVEGSIFSETEIAAMDKEFKEKYKVRTVKTTMYNGGIITGYTWKNGVSTPIYGPSMPSMEEPEVGYNPPEVDPKEIEACSPFSNSLKAGDTLKGVALLYTSPTLLIGRTLEEYSEVVFKKHYHNCWYTYAWGADDIDPKAYYAMPDDVLEILFNELDDVAYNKETVEVLFDAYEARTGQSNIPKRKIEPEINGNTWDDAEGWDYRAWGGLL